MDFCILHMFLLVMMLLFLIAIICYYTKHRSKQKSYMQKSYWRTNNKSGK